MSDQKIIPTHKVMDTHTGKVWYACIEIKNEIPVAVPADLPDGCLEPELNIIVDTSKAGFDKKNDGAPGPF